MGPTRAGPGPERASQEALFQATQVDDVALAEFALDKGAVIEALDAPGMIGDDEATALLRAAGARE